jgi:hypothetical protein
MEFHLQVSSVLPIPVYAAVVLYRSEGTLWQRLSGTIRCTPDFGPLRSCDRKAYLKDVHLHPPVLAPVYPPQEDLNELQMVENPLNQ